METFLWVEQYRPKDIESCVLPKNLKDMLHDFVSEGNVPNLILSGTYDIGVSSKNISHFVNTNVGIQYWIALEPESKYDA